MRRTKMLKLIFPVLWLPTPSANARSGSGAADLRWRKTMKRKLGYAHILLALALGIPGTAMAQATSGADENKKPAATDASTAAQTSPKPDGDYVGSEVCVTCHEEQHKSFMHTIMGNAMAHPKSALDARGCEACHGPGKAHVD